MASGTRIQVFGNAAGTQTINTLYLVEEIQAGQWPTLAAKVDNDWCRKVNFCQATVFTWTGCQISWLSPTGPASQFFAFNRPGAVVGLLPMQVAFVLKLGTGFSGRSNQGRWYISGVCTSNNNLGMPSAAVMTQWPTQLAAIMTAWGIAVGSPYTLGVYSRKQGIVQPVLNLTCSPIWGTLRSRRFGVGI